MGPGDPFAEQGGWTPPSPGEEFDGGADGPGAANTPPPGRSAGERRGRFLLFGLLLGLAFGAVVVLGGPAAALVITLCGAVGLGAGWVAYAVVHEELDVRGAIRALRRGR